ncbi:MAG TPA: adenosine deaminase [Gemmatimonadaceae bacterium]|nr:adenosine deaminase [Gemmatimonadaceae bacterium]
MIDRDQLRRLPKAELHCHLDGSLRPATLLELAREYSVPVPAGTPEALAAYMHADDARHLEDYLERFELTIAVMQTEPAIERVAYELCEDAVADGIWYLEVRNAPLLNTRSGLAVETALEAALRGFERAERELGIAVRFILCALRQLHPTVSLEMSRLAVAYRERGVIAFDLAGPEAGNPAAAHAAAFALAREHDLAVTVHAGEGDGGPSIRQAVHACGAHRIGHGTRLYEDESLAAFVTDRRIPLEVCLTSNVQTQAVASYESHPLRSYFERGAVVTLNTDNRLMSATTLTDEFWHASHHLGFSWDELCTVALAGFHSAFLPWEERLALADRAQAEIAAIPLPRRISA